MTHRYPAGFRKLTNINPTKMNKTFLIIQREFLTRVKKKTFIISTLLFPLLYLGLIFWTTYIGVKSSTKLNIAVIDSSGKFTA